jgi:hypothetical protein
MNAFDSLLCRNISAFNETLIMRFSAIGYHATGDDGYSHRAFVAIAAGDEADRPWSLCGDPELAMKEI